MFRILKLGLISIVFFALMITMISLFFPSRVRISKAIDISSSSGKVMLLIRDSTQWKKWYPGAGSATHLPRISSITDSSVTAATEMDKGRSGITGWNIYPSAEPNTITIQWYMDFKLRWYPWEKFSGLLLEKRYGPVMEKGLENLKLLLEDKTNSPG